MTLNERLRTRAQLGTAEKVLEFILEMKPIVDSEIPAWVAGYNRRLERLQEFIKEEWVR